MEGAVAFIRGNLEHLFVSAAGEELGGMMRMMGTDVVMRYVTAGYQRYI